MPRAGKRSSNSGLESPLTLEQVDALTRVREAYRLVFVEIEIGRRAAQEAGDGNVERLWRRAFDEAEASLWAAENAIRAPQWPSLVPPVR